MITNGVGSARRATYGERADTVLDAKLQQPNDVEANKVGKTDVCAMQSISKAAVNPKSIIIYRTTKNQPSWFLRPYVDKMSPDKTAGPQHRSKLVLIPYL